MPGRKRDTREWLMQQTRGEDFLGVVRYETTDHGHWSRSARPSVADEELHFIVAAGVLNRNHQ